MNSLGIKIRETEVPKYIQIYSEIKKIIEQNKFRDGYKLPTIRALSNELKVNKATVISAYKKLQDDGYVVQKIGSGTFVKKIDGSRNIKKIYKDVFKKITTEQLEKYIDFTGETSSTTLFSVEVFKDVLDKVLERDGAKALVYQELLGFEGLRESIVENFWDSSIKADEVLIVSGAQQGLDIVTKALINNRDGVVIEKPTYGGALAVFNWRRAYIHEIEIEEDGINIEKLENLLRKNKIKFLYLMSYFQNPTGATYSEEKKRQILALASIYDFYIIEDDYLSELIYDPNIKYQSFKQLDQDNRVIYIKSFSKIFLPGIRIGYLIAPAKFRERIQNAKINSDIATSSLMQRALDLYINSGYWREYIEKLNSIYMERYKFMFNKLEEYLSDFVEHHCPGGGMNFYVKLKDNVNINSHDLFQLCRKDFVLITPGAIFYKDMSEGSRFFRIGFSQTDEKQIEEGLRKISAILKKYKD
ncbi:MAG: PLP-dependent aminotransferase family protein [Clostridia bacterium]|jgi:DNA-binding transcriptional MocR family regulator|nr:PLP-dependent aminotransferase family protein [Clostridia bacterium]